MKKVKGITIENVTMNDGRIQATVNISGKLQESEVNPKWVVAKLSIGVKVDLKPEDILLLFGSDLRIALATQFRKCDGAFVESINGRTMSLAALEATIAANVPATAGGGKAAEIAKMRTMLKGMGMTDEEIDEKLASM